MSLNGTDPKPVDAPGRTAQSATKEDAPKDPPEANKFIELALQMGEFWTTSDGLAMVTMQSSGKPRLAISLRSGRFRSELTKEYFKLYKKVPNNNARQNAIDVLEGMAYDGPDKRLHNRTAVDSEDNVYINLSNDADKPIIKITENEWKPISQDDCPIEFHKGTGRPLDVDLNQGCDDLEAEIYRVFNIRKEDVPMVLAFCVASLLPREIVGAYPICEVHGFSRSGKGTIVEGIKLFIDPAKPLLEAEPTSAEDMIIGANNSHVVAFDNLETIPRWMSNVLCTIATGIGRTVRKKYSDGDTYTTDVMNPQLLTGLTRIAKRADLVQRVISIATMPLGKTKKRLRKTQSSKDIAAIQPKVTHSLLNAVSGVLKAYKKNYETNTVEVMDSPIPDFIDIALAAEAHMGWGRGEFPSFINSYNQLISDGADTVIEGSFIGDVLLAFLNDLKQKEKTYWEGTTSQLAGQLESFGTDGFTTSPKWKNYKAALNNLSSEVEKLAQVLTHYGWTFSRAGHRKLAFSRTVVDTTDNADNADNAESDPQSSLTTPNQSKLDELGTAATWVQIEGNIFKEISTGIQAEKYFDEDRNIQYAAIRSDL